MCGLISDKRPVHLRGVCLEDKSEVIDREQFSFEEAMLNADTQYVIGHEQPQIGCNKKYVNVIKALTKVYTENSNAEKGSKHNTENNRTQRNWRTIIPNYSVPFLTKNVGLLIFTLSTHYLKFYKNRLSQSK